jgi:ribose/xylose/arabinose/galactoside ABC-type transport system permease subunit
MSTVSIEKLGKDGLSTYSFANLMKKYGIFISLAVMFIALSFLSETFFTPQNLINILRQVSINGIIAIGMTFVILTGGIDLSVGSLVAAAGVIAGSIVCKDPNAIWFALFAAMVTCGVFGLLNGLGIAKFNMPPFVMTMAVMTVARGFAYVYSDGRPYLLQSDSFNLFGQGHIGPIPIPVIIFLVLIIAVSILLARTKFGRYVYAVGGNENAASTSGVNVSKVKILVYLISGVLTGLSGVILASRINSGQPAVGNGYELDAIAAVVIGGTSLNGGIGNIWGTLVGIFIIGIINNGLNLLNVSSYYQLIVKGIIIAGAVFLDQRTKRK